MGELGVGVACEGGVGRVDICWPDGLVVVLLVRPGWAAGGGGEGRQRVWLWVVVVGWRRLRRLGGGGEVVTSGAGWCTVVVKGGATSDGGGESEDEKVKVNVEGDDEGEDGRGKEHRWRLGRIFISG